MKVRNLTPHEIIFVSPDTPDRLAADDPVPPALAVLMPELPAQATPRAKMVEHQVGHVAFGGVVVPLFETSIGEPTNLPAPQAEVYLVVSAMTAQAAPRRTDLLVPHRTVFRHSSEGGTTVMGVKALARIKPTC